MGREEDDRTRTIAIIPYPSESVQLRLSVNGKEIRGYYRQVDEAAWHEAGDEH